MCLYPKLIKNKKYTNNKKNGGKIPPVSDERTLLVPVGCGKCIECMKQKKRNWQVRLMEEIRDNNEAVFVTMTFTDKKLQEYRDKLKWIESDKILDNEVATLAVREFLERYRKHNKKSVKHWLITELGQTKSERIHLHGLLFKKITKEELEGYWQNGICYVGTFVNNKTINYIVKYVNKIDTKHKNYVPKILTSPGIGKGYLYRHDSKINKYNGKETKEYYRTREGYKLNLPIYYRNQLYSEEERERLWLNKLDKETRFVCGEEIDVSKNDDEYFKTLEHYRVMNKQIGYGDDSIDWDKRLYKSKLLMMKKTRD